MWLSFTCAKEGTLNRGRKFKYNNYNNEQKTWSIFGTDHGDILSSMLVIGLTVAINHSSSSLNPTDPSIQYYSVQKSMSDSSCSWISGRTLPTPNLYTRGWTYM